MIVKIVMQQRGRVLVVEGDVTDAAALRNFAILTARRFGPVDVLVANAGIARFTSLTECDAELVRAQFETNVFGLMALTRAVLPAMKARGGGRIVNISSGVAFKGNPWMAHYVASKGAVVSLTRALATELGPFNILVNSVAPGFTLSDGVLENPGLAERVRQPSVRTRVLAREMTPADLVGAIAFFAGPDGAFVTGQTLVVDGGIALFNWIDAAGVS